MNLFFLETHFFTSLTQKLGIFMRFFSCAPTLFFHAIYRACSLVLATTSSTICVIFPLCHTRSEITLYRLFISALLLLLVVYRFPIIVADKKRKRGIKFITSFQNPHLPVIHPQLLSRIC